MFVNASGFPLDTEWPVLVTVRGVACEHLVRRSLDLLTCVVPRGYGAAAPVVLHTLLQSSNADVTIAYGAPTSKWYGCSLASVDGHSC